MPNANFCGRGREIGHNAGVLRGRVHMYPPRGPNMVIRLRCVVWVGGKRSSGSHGAHGTLPCRRVWVLTYPPLGFCSTPIICLAVLCRFAELGYALVMKTIKMRGGKVYACGTPGLCCDAHTRGRERGITNYGKQRPCI